MKNKDKLSQLQAIAKSVVQKESERVNAVINKNKKREEQESLQKKTKPQIEVLDVENNKINAKPIKKNLNNKDNRSLKKIRFQAVFKNEDLDKIQETKIYLLQKGLSNVSSNGILQAALRILEHDFHLVEAYSKIIDEDNRRKID